MPHTCRSCTGGMRRKRRGRSSSSGATLLYVSTGGLLTRLDVYNCVGRFENPFRRNYDPPPDSAIQALREGSAFSPRSCPDRCLRFYRRPIHRSRYSHHAISLPNGRKGFNGVWKESRTHDFDTHAIEDSGPCNVASRQVDRRASNGCCH